MGPPLQGESGTSELQGRRLELLLWLLLLDIPEVWEKEELPPDWKEPDVKRELSLVGRAEPFAGPLGNPDPGLNNADPVEPPWEKLDPLEPPLEPPL